jgi:hypothetical protein
MNIFTLDQDPVIAARMLCDKHVPKMCVEGMQCLVSALLKSGANGDKAPMTKAGTRHKGGYHNHPIVEWVAESHQNFSWLVDHTQALCEEYTNRWGKTHTVELQLAELHKWTVWSKHIPIVENHTFMFPRCFKQSQGLNEDLLEWEDDIEAAREFYFRDKKGFAEWRTGARDSFLWWKAKMKGEKEND